MNERPNIYVYKMTTDNGGAPCVHRGLLSLAICKPSIRRRARVGDVVCGFGGRRFAKRLIYVARVSAKVEGGKYYANDEFARRPDCIYRATSAGLAKLKSNAQFHNDRSAPQLDHDVGPGFERADVLLSDDFRYFGANGATDYQIAHPRIAELIDQLGRGHRVNFHPAVEQDLLKLMEDLWRVFPRKKNGTPSDGDRSRRCNTGCVIEHKGNKVYDVTSGT